MAVHSINFTIIPGDTRLDNHGVNKGVSPILFDGEKEDFQIDLLFLMPSWPGCCSGEIDGAFLQIHHFRDGLWQAADRLQLPYNVFSLMRFGADLLFAAL